MSTSTPPAKRLVPLWLAALPFIVLAVAVVAIQQWRRPTPPIEISSSWDVPQFTEVLRGRGVKLRVLPDVRPVEDVTDLRGPTPAPLPGGATLIDERTSRRVYVHRFDMESYRPRMVQDFGYVLSIGPFDLDGDEQLAKEIAQQFTVSPRP